MGTLICGLFVTGIAWWNYRSPMVKLWPGLRATVPTSLRKPDPPASDYVGGEACRRCHQAIWDRYQTHPMAHSAASTHDATPIEDFDQNSSFSVTTPVGEKEYRVERTSAGQFHHESLTDPVLGQIYDQRVKIEYAIGSGHHGRSYLLTENGCVFMSPISWYSQQGRWDLSPAYQPDKNPRLARSHWNKLLKRNPNDESALRRMADISVTSADLPAARDALTRFLKVNNWQSSHLSRLAGIYGSLGDFDAAKRTALEALRVNPSAADPHGVLTKVFELQGNPASAARHKKIYAKLKLQK